MPATETTAKPAFDKAGRLQQLPPYLFAEIDKAKRAAKAAGQPIIDFGVGDPDLPTPPHIIKRLAEAANDPANHRYALDQGLPELRQAIAQWYRERHHVELDPQTEILPLIGSKEGIAHAPLALANPGDVVLIPEPGYPPYRSGTLFAGAEPVLMPLLEENGFLPDLGGINQKAARRAKLMFLNYPNNPTAALATAEFYNEAIALAREYRFLIAQDAAYSEMAFDGERPVSFLSLPGAKEVGIEFHSLSKTYCMTGWRIGWVAGHAQAVAAIGQLKANLDSGIFQAIQWAGIEALQGDQQPAQEAVATYQRRRDLLVDGLHALGWSVATPKATFYVWAKIPQGTSSIAYATQLLAETSLVVTPGVGFGPHGEGYIRWALTVPEAKIQEALARLPKIG